VGVVNLNNSENCRRIEFSYRLGTPQTVQPSNTDFDSPKEEFAFIHPFELEVYNAIHQIRSNAIDHILQWSLRNRLSINAAKSQAMVVSLRLLQLDDTCQILLDGNTIDFHQKVQHLRLKMNSKLTWDDQI
jgi:hypothetical protein